MYKRVRVKLNERVIIFKNGIPKRAYGPGRHLVWGFDITEQRFSLDKLAFRALPEVRAVMPDEWYVEVELGELERGVLYRDGLPDTFLGAGRHFYFRIDPSVHLVRFDVREAPPQQSENMRVVLPRAAVLEAFVAQHERGLLYRGGRFTDVLEPGRHVFWQRPEAPVSYRVVDTRSTQLSLAPQELMTRDKVTLRLNLSLEYAIVDVVKAAHEVADLHDALYLMVQLAAREFVAGVSLDELLEGRHAFTRFLEERSHQGAAQLGVRVERVGVKDVILPGEMKQLMNRVIEAEKQAAASVIERREKAASARMMANSARVMAEHPVLIRLEELQAMKEIAASIGSLHVVIGAEGLDSLLPVQGLKQLAKPS